MKYGLQMYSVRDVTDKDLAGALKKVAEMGYGIVEFAGFFGHEAAEVKAMLDEYGLECLSTHSGWEAAVNDTAAAIAYHKTIGATRYIIPGADLGTKEKLDNFIEKTNGVIDQFAAEGIALGYHNHSHEFIPTAEGIVIHEELQKRSKMNFQIDTFWAWNAGVDPIALIEKLKDRVDIIHLKDGIKGGEGKSIGLGDAPVKAVRKYCIENDILMVVESEGLHPTGLDEAKRCIDFLKICDADDGR